MKITYLFVAFVILTACSRVRLTQEQTTFKEKCLAGGHEWMDSMSEMKDGMMVGPPCPGCMPDEKTHICNKTEYEAYVK